MVNISKTSNLLMAFFALLFLVGFPSTVRSSISPDRTPTTTGETANLRHHHQRNDQQETLQEAILELVDDWDKNHPENKTLQSGEILSESHPVSQPPVISSIDGGNHERFSNESYSSFVEGSPNRNCSRCVLHKESIVLRLEAIKVQILSKLGMKHAPNISKEEISRITPIENMIFDLNGMQGDSPSTTSTPQDTSTGTGRSRIQTRHPPLAMSGRYDDEEYDDEEIYHLDPEKVFSFAQEPLAIWNISKEYNAKYFKFSPSLTKSRVGKAHLWVYLRPKVIAGHVGPITATVVVYQVAKGQPGKHQALLNIRSKKVDLITGRGSWVTLEVRKLVGQWFRNPDDNMGIVIHSYDNSGNQVPVVDDAQASQVPFMEVKIEKSHHRRIKRDLSLNCEENSNEVRCCRYPLTVDFEEFGWDWIIAPKRYEANYCSGECPYVFLHKYPHTHLVQQANPHGSAGPCCAPRKMSKISMLYFDNNHSIVYGMLPGMVVDKCGCS